MGGSICALKSRSAQIMEWLKEHSFETKTGLLLSNVHFVSDYVGKLEVTNNLCLTVFIDDKYQNIKAVTASKCMRKAIWFNNEKSNKYAKEPQKKLLLIAPQYRNQIVVAKNWNRVRKILSKVPKQIHF